MFGLVQMGAALEQTLEQATTIGAQTSGEHDTAMIDRRLHGRAKQEAGTMVLHTNTSR